MLKNHIKYVLINKTVMPQLVYTHVEPNNLLINRNGQLLKNTFKKLIKLFIKSNPILLQSDNADWTMIDQNGQQNNNNYKYFLIILHLLKNINYLCIYIIEILEMIFMILQQKIEIDLQLELCILLQELNNNQIKFYNSIYMLE